MLAHLESFGFVHAGAFRIATSPSICPPLIKFKALPKQAMFSGAAAGPSGEHSGDDQSALGLFLIRMRLSSCNCLFRMSFVVKSETPQTETLFSSVVRAPPGRTLWI